MRTRPRPGLAAAALAASLTLLAPPASADETDARALLKAMSDYLAGQSQIAFDYDTIREVVTADDQKLGLASSGTLALERPDKLRATRIGGFDAVEIVFDGSTLALSEREAGLGAQIPLSGDIDKLVDDLRDVHGFPLPAADLLVADPEAALMAEVTDVKDLGSGIIGGTECDHLAFRTDEVDWQLWIAQGDAPYPCRFAITSRKVSQAPEYSITIRNWRTGAAAAAGFDTAAATGKTGTTLEEFIAAVRPFPPSFTTGGNQ